MRNICDFTEIDAINCFNYHARYQRTSESPVKNKHQGTIERSGIPERAHFCTISTCATALARRKLDFFIMASREVKSGRAILHCMPTALLACLLSLFFLLHSAAGRSSALTKERHTCSGFHHGTVRLDASIALFFSALRWIIERRNGRPPSRMVRCGHHRGRARRIEWNEFAAAKAGQTCGMGAINVSIRMDQPTWYLCARLAAEVLLCVL